MKEKTIATQFTFNPNRINQLQYEFDDRGFIFPHGVFDPIISQDKTLAIYLSHQHTSFDSNTSGHTIWGVNPRGVVKVKVDVKGHLFGPAISFNNRKIVLHDQENNGHLWVIDTATQELTPLVLFRKTFNPRISPDGQFIASVSLDERHIIIQNIETPQPNYVEVNLPHLIEPKLGPKHIVLQNKNVPTDFTVINYNGQTVGAFKTEDPVLNDKSFDNNGIQISPKGAVILKTDDSIYVYNIQTGTLLKKTLDIEHFSPRQSKDGDRFLMHEIHNHGNYTLFNSSLDQWTTLSIQDEGTKPVPYDDGKHFIIYKQGGSSTFWSVSPTAILQKHTLT
jgi:Tol biopolymer transport system component